MRFYKPCSALFAYAVRFSILAFVVIITACQEGIRQDNQVAVQVNPEQQVTNLSTEEIALGKELLSSPVQQAIIKQQELLFVKIKMALANDREGLKYAIEHQDQKKFAQLLNFTEAEYKQFVSEHLELRQKWQTQFGSKKKLLAELETKYGCKVCNNAQASQIDEQLNRISMANPAIFQVLQAGGKNTNRIQSNDCEGNLSKQIQLQAQLTLCFTGLIACGSTVGALSGGVLMPVCVIAWVACNTAAVCSICSCA